MTYRMPRSLKNNFTQHYTPTNKGLDKLLRIDGYYSEREIINRKIPKGFFVKEFMNVIDTFYMNYLFFSDGIVLENMFGSDRSSEPDKLPKFLSKMVLDSSKSMCLYGTWGTYIISGDTIKTQFIHPSGSLNDSWDGWKVNFKILDNEAIKLIYEYPLYYSSSSDKKIYTEQFYMDRIKDEKPAIFIKSDVPKSDCWMKKEKWFWENELQYNDFIKKTVANTRYSQ